MIVPSRRPASTPGLARAPASLCEEKRLIPARRKLIGPKPAPEQNPRLAALPEFVTPEWLRENHHLMKADLRKLAAAIGEDYADWPAATDGSDEAAFWRAVHVAAQERAPVEGAAVGVMDGLLHGARRLALRLGEVERLVHGLVPGLLFGGDVGRRLAGGCVVAATGRCVHHLPGAGRITAWRRAGVAVAG